MPTRSASSACVSRTHASYGILQGYPAPRQPQHPEGIADVAEVRDPVFVPGSRVAPTPADVIDLRCMKRNHDRARVSPPHPKV
jgi:hypothetical protein